jgi:hypothetical protein
MTSFAKSQTTWQWLRSTTSFDGAELLLQLLDRRISPAMPRLLFCEAFKSFRFQRRIFPIGIKKSDSPS